MSLRKLALWTLTRREYVFQMVQKGKYRVKLFNQILYYYEGINLFIVYWFVVICEISDSF
ncbi:hypothetical protein pb186bvf_008551 [Paramecium bursaria]